MAHQAQLLGYLCERLRIEDWYRRHPEIDAQRIGGPIFVTGLPRTGTTALSHLLAADPDTRSLQMWESQQPTPPPERATYATDPRIAEADATLAGMQQATPTSCACTTAPATSPTENIDLLGQHFARSTSKGMAHVPSYIRWWLGCDMVPRVPAPRARAEAAAVALSADALEPEEPARPLPPRRLRRGLSRTRASSGRTAIRPRCCRRCAS